MVGRVATQPVRTGSARTGIAPRRRKSVRRAEILAAALEVFQAEGFDGASMSEIAVRADCVEGTLYTYFRNKRALFDAVLEAFYDALIADIEPRLGAISVTRDRLVYLVARHLRIALDDPGLSRLINAEIWGMRAYYGSRLHELNRRYAKFLGDSLREAVLAGELRADLDVQIARDLILGGIQHWVWNAINRKQVFEPEQVAAQFVDTLLPGWLRPADVSALDALSTRVERIERSIGIAPGDAR